MIVLNVGLVGLQGFLDAALSANSSVNSNFGTLTAWDTRWKRVTARVIDWTRY